ncbi:MAG: site-specific DNA-methyltransferase [Patescibacteria group bacterium]
MTQPSNSIKSGDIIQLGDHTLVCGDASTLDLKAILKDGKINAIITDPPYGIDYVASKRDLQKVSKDKDIQNDGHMSDAQYATFTQGWLGPALPYLTKKNSIYIFNSDKMVFALRQACVDMKIKVAQLLIWVKDKPVIGRLDYLPQHELILYGWYGTHDFKHSKDKSVLFAPKPQQSKLHPTMKPVGLIRKLILNCTEVGDVVYDPFGGSGTTIVACEHTKRKCVMVEQDLEYCATIVQRWEKLTGKKAHGRQES